MVLLPIMLGCCGLGPIIQLGSQRPQPLNNISSDLFESKGLSYPVEFWMLCSFFQNPGNYPKSGSQAGTWDLNKSCYRV